MRKFLLSMLTFVLLILGTTPVFAGTITNKSTGYEAVLDDQADFLTDDQERALLDQMAPITAYGNAVLVCTASHSYSSTENFAVNYFESRYGTHDDGVIFVIDMDCREIYLVTEGSTRKALNSARCNSITDNTYIYATESHDRDFYTCASETFSQVYTVLDGGKIAQPMKYICNALFAIMLALFFNYFVVMRLSQPKNPKRNEIMQGLFTKFAIMHPQVHFTHQTKKYSPPSSSGGSGGGGGGGGGGGHSGGGHSI